jgi:ubiquinone/menaquinone biosynthesis C-methylase UbiE
MNKSIAEYDSEAETYDAARFNNSLGRHFDIMHKQIVRSLIESDIKTILEIGIGTGRFGTWFAKRGFTVVGVDISKEMLKKAKKKAHHLNVNLDLVNADVQHLPFREKTFVNCVCVNVMDHFSDYEGFFKQVQNVIKPPGAFIFNFSNSQSPYLPIATIINLSKHALFKGKIYSKWTTLKEIKTSLQKAHFEVNDTRGFMITSEVPLGETFNNVTKTVNVLSEKSFLRFFSGSIFVKAVATRSSGKK